MTPIVSSSAASTESTGRRIYAALPEFIAMHRSAKVTERLDAVHAAEESQLDAPTAAGCESLGAVSRGIRLVLGL